MHYIVRRLYERLTEMGIYGLLDADTRDALECAYGLFDTLARIDDTGPNITSIGRDRIVETIGTGGMGIVYRATDPQRGQIVAIKLARRELADNVYVCRRFERQMKLMSGLVHPNVVWYFDSGASADGRPCVVMDYLDGLTLEAIVENARHAGSGGGCGGRHAGG